MDATRSEDAPYTSNFSPMDEERKRFLEDATGAFTVDVVKVLLEAIEVLSDPLEIRIIRRGASVPEDVATALNNIRQYIDDIDVANDFDKIGGFSIFPVCFGCENYKVRDEASKILAEICQNNPQCQARALQCGLLEVLLVLIQAERTCDIAGYLYAISGITSGNERAYRELTAKGGCKILTQLLCDNDLRVRTKTAFIISHLAKNYPVSKAQFLANNTIRCLVSELEKGETGSTACVLDALLALIEDMNPVAMKQLKDPALGLNNILHNITNLPRLNDPEYDDMRETLTAILDVYKKSTDVAAVNADGPDR